jgi:tetratricopeptide (TPR) repeat protein
LSGNSGQADPIAQGALARAVKAHARGDLTAAEAGYREAADAGDRDAAFQLGLILSDRGDRVGAAGAWERAAASGDLDSTLNLALLFADYLDRPDDARRLYQDAIARGERRAMFDYGSFLWRQGDHHGAEAAFQQVIDAGVARGHLMLGFLLAEEGRHEEALRAFERAAGLGVNEAWGQAGWQLARLGRLDEAERMLRRAQQHDDLASYGILPDVLERMGRSADAATVLTEAIERSRKNLSLGYRDHLSQLDGRGLEEEALRRWAHDECDSRLPLVLAALLFDAARLAEAETRLTLAVDHGDEDAIHKLAQLYEKTGRRRRAQALRDSPAANRIV